MKNKESIGRLMGTIYRYTRIHYHQEFTNLELGSGGHLFILKLYEKDGLTQNEITGLLHFDKAHTARTILKLIDLGYVRKKQDETDKRSYRLFLTKKGKDIVPTIKRIIKNWNQILTSEFSNDEKKMLLGLLQKMAEKSVNEVKPGLN